MKSYRDTLLEMLNNRTDDPNERVYQILYTILVLNPETPKRVTDNQMFSILEVCEILGVSRRTIYRYIDSGRLKPVKVGRDYKFSPEEIERIKKGGA